MSLLARDGYLNSRRLLLIQQRRRQARHLYFKINNVEPRAKHSMPGKYKDEIQAQLLKQLIDQGRRAFRGSLALRIKLGTTDGNPTQPHHIAKNLLDLFGKPRPGLSTRRRALLYEDDNQVHALSVSCVHGQTSPFILGIAYPLSSLLEDLSLAVQSQDWDEDGNPGNTAFGQFSKDLDQIEELSQGGAKESRGPKNPGSRLNKQQDLPVLYQQGRSGKLSGQVSKIPRLSSPGETR